MFYPPVNVYSLALLFEKTTVFDVMLSSNAAMYYYSDCSLIVFLYRDVLGFCLHIRTPDS